MGLAQFYAPSRYGTPWGVRDALHPNPHRGMDIKAAPGEAVPLVRGGTIVIIKYSSILGWFVTVAVPDGTYDSYCHLRGVDPSLNFIKISQKLNRGDTVGYIAGWNDSHGSAWSGPHLHLVTGPGLLSGYTGVNYNPKPLVQAALTAVSAASSEVTPIPVKKRDVEMQLSWDTNGSGYLVTSLGIAGVPSPQIYNLFYRQINSDQAKSPFVNGARPVEFNALEISMMNNLLNLIARTAVPGAPSIDPVKLASAISDALPGKLTISATIPKEVTDKLDQIYAGVEGVYISPEEWAAYTEVSQEQLAEAFDKAAPRVARAILKQQAAALAALPDAVEE